MADVAPVLADLQAESADLDALVADLDDAGWHSPTPAKGWTIAHQIGHLAWTDDIAVLAATDPDAFTAAMQASLAAPSEDPAGAVDHLAAEWAAQPDVFTVWRAGRDRLAAALAAVPPDRRLPWLGPPMSATSMATARLMETWAHGQDVADALGVTRPATDRLRHVAHIGVRTRDFAYALHDLPAPDAPFRVELAGPYGDVWTWGPDDATNRVTGPAVDFCLLVTQRAHRADLGLTAQGDDADRWLDIAQAFAGPPGEGREPRAQR